MPCEGCAGQSTVSRFACWFGSASQQTTGFCVEIANCVFCGRSTSGEAYWPEHALPTAPATMCE